MGRGQQGTRLCQVSPSRGYLIRDVYILKYTGITMVNEEVSWYISERDETRFPSTGGHPDVDGSSPHGVALL
jgi:hypothetical protein